MNPEGKWNLNPMASYRLYEQLNSVRAGAGTSPLTMTNVAIHMLQGDALRTEQFLKHARCHPTTVLTQFEVFQTMSVWMQ